MTVNITNDTITTAARAAYNLAAHPGAAEIERLQAENSDLRRKVSELSAKVGVLSAQVAALLTAREKMRSRIFEVAWEFAGSKGVKE